MRLNYGSSKISADARFTNLIKLNKAQLIFNSILELKLVNFMESHIKYAKTESLIVLRKHKLIEIHEENSQSVLNFLILLVFQQIFGFTTCKSDLFTLEIEFSNVVKRGRNT